MANNTITLEKFIDIFKSIADNHEMINDFGCGELFDIGASRPMNFPYLYVDPAPSTIINTPNGLSVCQYSFSLYVYDKKVKGDNNDLHTISDTDYIMKTIITFISKSEFFRKMGITVVGNVPLEYVGSKTDDDANGVYCNITLEQPITYTLCNIPVIPMSDFTTILNGNPSYSGCGCKGKGATGPQGVTGPQGFQGYQGPAGIGGGTASVGPQGPQGYQGPQGDIGIAGPQGLPGNDGFNGGTGPQGYQGPQGANGNDGISGVTGSQGPQGYQGPQGSGGGNGVTGSVGPQGFQGNQGYQGPQGDNGINGVTGPQGFQGSNGINGLTGSQGPQGYQGPVGLSGTASGGNDGSNTLRWVSGTWTQSGEFDMTYSGGQTFNWVQATRIYINIEEHYGEDVTDWLEALYDAVTIYDRTAYLQLTKVGDNSHFAIYKVDGPQDDPYVGIGYVFSIKHIESSYSREDGELYSISWVLNGADGDIGTIGTQGPQGFQGSIGPQGFQGVTGSQGFQGNVGPQGFQGNQGFQGSTGPQGYQGYQGPNGSQGFQGVTGPQGFQGPNGNNGSNGPQGFQGPTGPNGSNGSNGPQGFQGTQGPQGFQGNTGSAAAVNTTDNGLTYSVGSGLFSLNKTFITLTDGATVIWNMKLGYNAKVTLGGNRTLSITNPQNGDVGTLVITQTNRTLTLPSGSKVIGGGGGTASLTVGVTNAIDILTFVYDGTTYHWTYGKNYT